MSVNRPRGLLRRHHRRPLVCYTSTVGLIEAVPNVSEGRSAELIDTLATAIRSAPGIELLDTCADRTHNRTVFTLVGDRAAVKAALLALYATAVTRIDLRHHTGVHPRIGAVDVVPLVPLDHDDMPVCIALAAELGATVAERFHVPVYLYEDATSNPDRRHLEQIRRGGFEGLPEKMRDPRWRPDFGPPVPHRSAGASAIGARRLLIAYNVNLETDDLDVARRIASHIRAANGGLAAVKAIGVRTDQPDVVQVSINLVDYHQTPLYRVFEAVTQEAARHGVAIRGSEIVGLAPAAALLEAATRHLQLDGFTIDQVLDCRLRR
jgi:glutamate formiminotransferase